MYKISNTYMENIRRSFNTLSKNTIIKQRNSKTVMDEWALILLKIWRSRIMDWSDLIQTRKLLKFNNVGSCYGSKTLVLRDVSIHKFATFYNYAPSKILKDRSLDKI